MRGEASRIADRVSRDSLAPRLRDSGEDAWRIGNELFTITNALDHNVQLERALTDPSRPVEDKVAVVKTLIGDEAHPLTMEIMSDLVARRWSRVSDIANATEDFGVDGKSCLVALVFWIRSRIHEIGTLLALGIGKMQIIAQFAIETGLMAVVAALCSLGTGSLLSGYVSSLLLHDSGVAPLESLQVEALPPEQTLLILLLGCAVIAIALAVSCAAVLAKSPKSILSSMR